MSNFPQRWFVYRKKGTEEIIEKRLDHRMICPWLFGWQLFDVVTYSLTEHDIKKPKKERKE